MTGNSLREHGALPGVDDRPAPIAFLIQAHNDPDQLKRLVSHLGNNKVFIHWDAKSGSVPTIPGATIIDERIAVFWAGFSQVRASIALVRSALAERRDYTKLVLLSGSCYPIRPVSELETLFAGDGGHNYLNSVRVKSSEHLRKLVRQRLWRDQVLPLTLRRSKTVVKLERILRAALNMGLGTLPKRMLNMELFHGSNWWALTPEAAAFAAERYENDPALRRFYRFTFASDEQFFHTVLRNSRFSETCSAPIETCERGVFQTANLHLIDPSLSRWFDEGGIEQIEASDRFFLRKLCSGQSDRLLDWIDRTRLCAGPNQPGMAADNG